MWLRVAWWARACSPHTPWLEPLRNQRELRGEDKPQSPPAVPACWLRICSWAGPNASLPLLETRHCKARLFTLASALVLPCIHFFWSVRCLNKKMNVSPNSWSFLFREHEAEVSNCPPVLQEPYGRDVPSTLPLQPGCCRSTRADSQCRWLNASSVIQRLGSQLAALLLPNLRVKSQQTATITMEALPLCFLLQASLRWGAQTAEAEQGEPRAAWHREARSRWGELNRGSISCLLGLLEWSIFSDESHLHTILLFATLFALQSI